MTQVKMQRNPRRLVHATSWMFLGFALIAGGLLAQDNQGCADCAQSGRTAAQLQSQALQAEELVGQIPSMTAEADRLKNQAFAAYNNGDKAIDHAREWADLARSAKELAERTGATNSEQAAAYKKNQADAMADFEKQEALGKKLMADSEALRAKADSAKDNADKLTKAAAQAWQAYHDCLKKKPCPPPSSPGKTATGFSNCPEAQEWMDRANEIRKRADRERGFAAQARASGDTKSAENFDQQAKSSDSSAALREREAAYALQRCAEKAGKTATGGPGGANQTPGGPTATVQPTGTPTGTGQPTGGASATPGNSTPTGQSTGTGQPTAATTPPPGAIVLPRNGDVAASITITNSCKTVELFHIEISQLPEDMVQVSDTLRVAANSSRDFPVTYSSKGHAPGLYSGTITVVCDTCVQSCPQGRKALPVQLFVPAQ